VRGSRHGYHTGADGRLDLFDCMLGVVLEERARDYAISAKVFKLSDREQMDNPSMPLGILGSPMQGVRRENCIFPVENKLN
jgi:hypothetical protein